MALKKCKNCGKEFEGNARQFCSWQCSEAYGRDLKSRLDSAIKNDKGHTDRLSVD